MQRILAKCSADRQSLFSYDWGGKEIIVRIEGMVVTHKESSWATDGKKAGSYNAVGVRTFGGRICHRDS